MFRKFPLALVLLAAGLLSGCAGGTGIANNQPGPGNGNGTNGTFSASAISMDLGNVNVGATKTGSVTLTNTFVSQSVTVSQLSVSGAGFSLSSSLTTPFTVEAGQNTSVGITFAPGKAGSATGSLSVTNSSSDPNLQVGLSGDGMEPGQIGASPTTLNLGNVTVGSAGTGTVTVSNAAGGQNVTITQVAISGTGFSVSAAPSLPFLLAAGQNTNIGVTFSASGAGAATGQLSVISNAENPDLTVNLEADGITQGQLAAQPSSLTFTPVGIGQTSSGSVSLNNSESQSVTVSQITLTGAGFAFNPQPSLPMVIPAGQSTALGVNFTPAGAGIVSGNITVVSNALDPNFSIGLSGDGLGANQLGVSPGTFAFGSVVVNTSASLPGSLTAGSTPIMVSSANWAGSGFSVTGISFPVTVPAGQSVPFTVVFDPGSAGAVTGSVSFVSDASNSPTGASFNGTGIQPPSVALTWSDSGQVSGYNVYRGTTSGGPYPTKLNSSLVPQTNFTDTNVQSGNTYYYVTTAVNSGGQESAYSSPASAMIP